MGLIVCAFEDERPSWLPCSRNAAHKVNSMLKSMAVLVRRAQWEPTRPLIPFLAGMRMKVWRKSEEEGALEWD